MQPASHLVCLPVPCLPVAPLPTLWPPPALQKQQQQGGQAAGLQSQAWGGGQVVAMLTRKIRALQLQYYETTKKYIFSYN